MFGKTQKKYVSETDKFLEALAEKFSELSASQKKRVARFDRIEKLRDDKTAADNDDTMWTDF